MKYTTVILAASAVAVNAQLTASNVFLPTTTSSPSLNGSTTITATGTSIYTSAGVTVTEVFTTTYCPDTPLSTIILPSASGYPSHPSNGTSGSGSGSAPIVTGTGSSPTGSGSSSSGNGTTTGGSGSNATATATPVGPTTTATSTFTSGALTNSASGALAAVGLAVAYFL